MQRRARRSRSVQIDIDTVSICDSTATDVSDKENKNAVPRDDKQKDATQCLLRRNKKASPAKTVFSALSSERKTKNKPMADKSQSTPNRRPMKKAQVEPENEIQKTKSIPKNIPKNVPENIEIPTENQSCERRFSNNTETSPKTSKKQLFNSSDENITTNLAPPSPPTANTVKFDIPISPIAVKKKRERKIKREKSQKLEDNYHGMSYIDVMFKELEEESVKEKKNGVKEAATKRKHNLSGNKSMNKSADKSADFSFGVKKPRRTSKVVDLTAEQIREIEEFELDIEVVPKCQESHSKG